jgi:hypothetical protein
MGMRPLSSFLLDCGMSKTERAGLDSENRRAHTGDSANISKRRMRLFTEGAAGANTYRYRGSVPYFTE